MPTIEEIAKEMREAAIDKARPFYIYKVELNPPRGSPHSRRPRHTHESIEVLRAFL